MKQTIELSWESIFKVVAVILGLAVLWQIRDVLALFFIIVVLVAALAPVVDRWSTTMPRIVAVSLLYLLIISIMLIAALVIIPPLVHELGQLSINLPSYVSHVSLAPGAVRNLVNTAIQNLDTLSQGLAGITGTVYSTTVGIVGTVVGALTVAVVTFYLLLEERGMRNLIASYVPVRDREKFTALLHQIGAKMGAWLRGQLLLGVIVGTLDFIGMLIIGVPFALTLGVWAAITEIVPYIGPVLGAIPAVAIAFADAPLKGLFTLILFVIVQQLEANFIVPRVMSRAVGLSPVIIIFAILIGAKLAGILGVILAVPAAAAISVLVKDFGGHLYAHARK